MINSMTGYGDAEGQLDGVTYIVEIKGVNNRYFKPRIKLPETVAFLEEEIYELLRKCIVRGSVDCILRLKNVSADMLFEINTNALTVYLNKLKEVSAATGVEGPMDVGGLLNLPGILEPMSPDEKKAVRVKDFVLDLTRKAVEKFRQMRRTEGAELEADLLKNCDEIKNHLEKICAKKDEVLQQYHERLRGRVDELMAGVNIKLDPETLSREIAMFAERSDISEEVTRLASHLKQFADNCKMDGQAGRRLDFLGQEMLREANTIASKASDAEISHCVVDIKCCIDRLKEQVQNVE
ncbi:MAG: YicC/YloC family endoribonuclease [Phycisphaerae bacterium]|jgi:uncharacterized protein (TIGR00255 family)